MSSGSWEGGRIYVRSRCEPRNAHLTLHVPDNVALPSPVFRRFAMNSEARLALGRRLPFHDAMNPTLTLLPALMLVSISASMAAERVAVREAIAVEVDAESGAAVVQLTSQPVISTNVHMEQRFTSGDGRRIAIERQPFGQLLEPTGRSEVTEFKSSRYSRRSSVWFESCPGSFPVAPRILGHKCLVAEGLLFF
jgi:hypothetical protein